MRFANDIDTKLALLGDATNLGRQPTGILALLVPMRSELKISEQMTRIIRHELMEILTRYDLEKCSAELATQGKALWRVQGCVLGSCFQ